MSIPKKLQKFLKRNKVYYQILVHPRTVSAAQTAEVEHVPGKEIAKVVMVKAGKKNVMTVIPGDSRLDLLKLSSVLGTSDLRVEEEKEFQDLFPDCEIGAMPPVGSLYQLSCYVDQGLAGEKEIFFNGGNHEETIRVYTKDFIRAAKAVTGDFAVRDHLTGVKKRVLS